MIRRKTPVFTSLKYRISSHMDNYYRNDSRFYGHKIITTANQEITLVEIPMIRDKRF